ncbi:DUF1684 domain-containing protein [Haloflavibacter putidus]|uniref:DUF1684 domain-containing protein n=1 Tax=Haloflavibacter putidus TaxID=2576776 RepID=A0A507ZMF0_9FLAO|nr:DUF1684 domain-containing protein [Haloflavibacter putidus]TQD38886.1 DUF1684 domain-containing protein [Haloflavibacter putidus]
MNSLALKSVIFLVLLFPVLVTGQGNQNFFESTKTYRDSVNQSFQDSETSPLTKKDRRDFTELSFFKPDPAYQVKAKFVRTPAENPFAMPTTTQREAMYVKYGEVHFSLQGKDLKLNVYQNERLVNEPEYANYLFIPFTDISNGEITYGGGRYLDFKIPKSDNVILDFNKAYNPYCAYNGRYSCPIPPAENHLEIPIKAGVKKFKSKPSNEQ